MRSASAWRSAIRSPAGRSRSARRMGAAICSAVNDWIIEHWLNQEPRLRASIVVPAQAPLLAAEEIERRAADQRFVQILMPAGVRDDAGPQLLLADLRGRGEIRPADRAARRQHVPLRADLRRLAVALSARLRGELADLRGPVAQPDLERRVQPLSRPALRADRIRRDLAAWLHLARDQDLARRARRGAVGEALAGRDDPREYSPDRATDRRAARYQRGGAHHRADRQRPDAAVRLGLSALAVRGRRGAARRACHPTCCGASAWTIRWRPILA